MSGARRKAFTAADVIFGVPRERAGFGMYK
jgi:hypothetical protein